MPYLPKRNSAFLSGTVQDATHAALDFMGATTIGVQSKQAGGTLAVVTIEESIDGSTWFSTGVTTTGSQLTSVAPKGRLIRGKVTTPEAGTTSLEMLYHAR